MPRRPKGSWDSTRQCWVAALGPWYTDANGRRRRRVVTLTYPDGTYVGKHDEAGKSEALARLIREAADRDRRGQSPSTAALFSAWRDWHRFEGHATHASDENRRHLIQRICNVPYGAAGVLGDVPADEVGFEHLFAVRTALRAAKVASGGIRNHDAAFLAAFRWAAKAVEGRSPLVMLAVNPFPPGSVSSPPSYRSNRQSVSWDEMLAIMDAMDEFVERTRPGYGGSMKNRARQIALWVRVIAERGCRPLEVAERRVEEWDDEIGGFRMGAHKTMRHGLAGVLPIRPETVDRVRALIAVPKRRGPWVFAPHRTEAMGAPRRSVVGNWWRLYRDEFGAEDLTLYSFRNCVSNKLRLAGVEGRNIQLAMRHSTPVADTVYRRDDLAEAAEVFRAAGM